MARAKRGNECAEDVGDVRLARRMRREGKAVTWHDVDSLVSTDVTSQIELPPWLLRDRVFQFLAAPPSTFVTDVTSDPKRYARALGPLRAVCHQWQKLVQFLLKEAQLRIKTVDIHLSTSTSLTRLVKEAAKDGATVEELTLVLSRSYMRYRVRAYASLKIEPLCKDLWWDRLLQPYANVLRLDLSMVPVECFQWVLASAGRSCPSLQVLILPVERPYFDIANETKAEAAVSIVQALEALYDRSGGLLVLTTPWWTVESADRHREFIEAVAKFCPKLEYLKEIRANDPVIRQALGSRTVVSLDTWTRFCMGCTWLRKFEYSTNDHSLDKVRAFVATPKPYLEELYACHAGDTVHLSLVVELVQQCPRLRVLDLTFEHPNSVSPTPWKELVRAIGEHCHDLETLCIRAHSAMGPIPAQLFDSLMNKRLLREVHLGDAQLASGTFRQALQHACKSSLRLFKLRLQPRDTHQAFVSLLNSLESFEQPELLGNAMLDWAVTGSIYADFRAHAARAESRFSSLDFHLELAPNNLKLHVNCSPQGRIR